MTASDPEAVKINRLAEDRNQPRPGIHPDSANFWSWLKARDRPALFAQHQSHAPSRHNYRCANNGAKYRPV